MKIVFVTDLHGNRQALDWISSEWMKYQGMIVGGDISLWEEPEHLRSFHSAVEQVKIPVYFIPGNHEREPPKMPPGVMPLHGRTNTLDGFKLGGLGGSNVTPFSTPFELNDEQARRILASLGGVDILVSHTPPLGTRCDCTGTGHHVGSSPVREYVEKFMPKLVLCGHIHESMAIDDIGPTRIVNPGPLMDGRYAILELSKPIRVELGSVSSSRHRVPTS